MNPHQSIIIVESEEECISDGTHVYLKDDEAVATLGRVTSYMSGTFFVNHNCTMKALQEAGFDLCVN